MLKRMIAVACMAAAPLVVSAPANAATGSSCPGGHYPASLVGGRPTEAKVGMTGMALWLDHGGWHLRVSEAGKDKAVITGRIYTDGRLLSVQRHTEGRDSTLSVGTHRLVYRFVNYGGVDGIDFVLPCSSQVKFAVSIDHHGVSTDHIVIGKDNQHPASNPFVISKA
jgi:hypothetical protein